MIYHVRYELFWPMFVCLRTLLAAMKPPTLTFSAYDDQLLLQAWICLWPQLLLIAAYYTAAACMQILWIYEV